MSKKKIDIRRTTKKKTGKKGRIIKEHRRDTTMFAPTPPVDKPTKPGNGNGGSSKKTDS